jgi:hypothetical protein
MILHTQGEWFALKQGAEIQSEEGMHEIGASVMVDGQKVLVGLAQMLHGQHGMMEPDGKGGSREYASYTVSQEEAYANACLMAAAKDMQDVLYDCFQLACLYDRPELNRRISDAIAKSKGE